MSQCCAGCERPILDRFLMHVLDRSWHSTCVQCDDCSQPLSNKCFSRDAKLYCRDDFYRRFGTKCGGCSLGISPDDLVRKAKNKVFHLHCFTCILCRKQLATGEQLYVVDDNRFLCKEDFINTRYYGSDDDLDIDQRILDKLDETLSEEKAAMCSGKLSPLGGSLPDDDSRSSTPHIGILAYNSETGLRNMQHPHRASLHAPPLLDGSSPCPSSSAKTSPVTSLLPEITTCKGVVTNELDQMGCSATGSMMLGVDPCLDPNADTCGDVEIDLDDSKDADSKDGGAGAKRRGPRTTIKAKQLETLKTAFSATPKPTRHIREQLAQETGLNMRVIQVWFQNRRSKERRMKQLSALGARRHFFRNPRRMRGLGRDDMGQELSLPPEMMGGPQGPFNYFDNEFYQNTYPAGFPGPIPDYYGPTPGSQPVHPVSGLPQGVATFMASPPGGSAVPGNQMGALLPTSGAAGLPQLHGLPSQGHHRIEGHPQMAPIDGLPPTPGQMTPDNIFNLTTGPDGLTMLAGNDSSPSSGCATGESLSSMANRYPPPGITSLTTVPLASLAPQSSIPPLPTAQTNLPPAINGFPQEMTVGDASW